MVIKRYTLSDGIEEYLYIPIKIIVKIIKAIAELSTGRRMIESIVEKQEETKKDQKIYNREMKKSIFTLVLVVILTFMFNVFFEVIRNYYI